eukprot:10477022-Karenia_brevis.AAC.1
MYVHQRAEHDNIARNWVRKYCLPSPSSDHVQSEIGAGDSIEGDSSIGGENGVLDHAEIVSGELPRSSRSR